MRKSKSRLSRTKRYMYRNISEEEKVIRRQADALRKRRSRQAVREQIAACTASSAKDNAVIDFLDKPHLWSHYNETGDDSLVQSMPQKMEEVTYLVKKSPAHDEIDSERDQLGILPSESGDINNSVLPDLPGITDSGDNASEMIIPDQLGSADSDKFKFAEVSIKTEEVLLSDVASDCGSGMSWTNFYQEVQSVNGVAAVVESLSCSSCTKTFLNKMALRSHIKTECFKAIFDPLAITEIKPIEEVKCESYDLSISDVKSNFSGNDHQKPAALVESRSCASCDKTFLNKSALSRHLKSGCCSTMFDPLAIPKTQPIEEVKCENFPQDINDEKPHSSKANRQKPVPAKRKPRRSTVKSSLEINLTCNKCQKSFKNMHGLKHHVRRHEVGNHVCPICHKAFIWPNELRNHLPVHSVEKAFECPICAEKFETYNQLKWHKMNHDDEGTTECDICKKTFRNKLAITRHIAKHISEKKCLCELCGATFRTREGRQFHVDTAHNSGEKNYECAECGKRFSVHDYLRRHILDHSRKQVLECDICGKQFTTAKSRNRHRLAHTGVKSEQCDDCGKTFLHSTYLRRHMNIVHSASKRFECTVCGKRFSANHYLKQHMLVHTGTKEYECEVCQKLFNNRSNRNKHALMHFKSGNDASTLVEDLFQLL